MQDPPVGGDISQPMSLAPEPRLPQVDAIYLHSEPQAAFGNPTGRKFSARFVQHCSQLWCGDCIS